jgi:hypothetical protein
MLLVNCSVEERLPRPAKHFALAVLAMTVLKRDCRVLPSTEPALWLDQRVLAVLAMTVSQAKAVCNS